MSKLFGNFSSVDWDMNTFYLYLVIVMGVFLLSFVSNTIVQMEGNRNKRNYSLCIVLPSIILLFIKCFVYCGTDLVEGYKWNFDTATSLAEIYDYTLEFLYKILNIIVRNITDQYEIFIVIVGLLTIIPICRIFEKYIDAISVPYAILIYVSAFYFQSFSLMRIYLSATIGMFVFERLVQEKYLHAFILCIMAGLMHSSGYILLVALVLSFFKNRKKLIILGTTALYAILFLGRSGFERFFVGRHSIYSINEEYYIGMEVFLFFVPLFALYCLAKYYMQFRIDCDEHLQVQEKIMDVSFVFLVLGTFLDALQYIVPIFGRMCVFTIPITAFVGCAIRILEKNCNDIRWVWIAKIGVIIYCLFRFVLYINGYYATDGIMPYVNFLFK